MSGRTAEEVRTFLESQDVLLPATLHDDTPLISSGHLDSLALLNLAQWIEERLERPLDVSTLDFRTAWDTINDIAHFIESNGAAASSPVSAPKPGRVPEGYRIEPYHPGFADTIAQLQTGLWSPDVEVNRAYFRWKDEENPYRQAPTAYVMFQGDRPIAMRSFFPARWEIGTRGQYRDILVADDFLVSEGHRNQGLATVLMAHALADLNQRGEEYVFNLSGGLVTVLHSLAMGWKSAGQLGPVGRVAGWHSGLNALRNRLPTLPYLWRFSDTRAFLTMRERSPFGAFDEAQAVAFVEPGEQIRLENSPRPTLMADLIERLPYDGRIRHVRDATYLAWRYRNPRNEYRFLYAGNERLRGFMALSWARHRLRPDPRVSIVDWEAENQNTLAALLDAAIRLGRFPSLRTWSAATPAPELLETRGFKPVDQHLTRHGCPCILVQSTQPGRRPENWRIQDRPLLGMENWDMRMLFSMVG